MNKAEAIRHLIDNAIDALSYDLENEREISKSYESDIESIIEMCFIGKNKAYISRIHYMLISAFLTLDEPKVLTPRIKHMLNSTYNRLNPWGMNEAVVELRLTIKRLV